MLSVNLTFYLAAKFTCPAGQFYHYNKFDCITACTDLYKNPITSICYTCKSTCNGCPSAINDCQACIASQNRVLNVVNNPKTCDCNYNNGYVDV
jgi:hypothetical protein